MMKRVALALLLALAAVGVTTSVWADSDFSGATTTEAP